MDSRVRAHRIESLSAVESGVFPNAAGDALERDSLRSRGEAADMIEARDKVTVARTCGLQYDASMHRQPAT